MFMDLVKINKQLGSSQNAKGDSFGFYKSDMLMVGKYWDGF